MVGGRPAPFVRRPRSSLADFLLAKCLRQKLCRPLETRLSVPSRPFTDTQKLPGAPTTSRRGCPWARSHFVSSHTYRAVWGGQPAATSPSRRRFFRRCPLPLRRLSHRPLPYYYFFFSPGVLAQKKCLPQSHGGKKQAKPTAKQRQLGRSAGPPPGSAPPASSTRDLHAVVPPWSPAPPPLTPGFLAPEDKRRTQVKIMELSGKEKAAGQRGAAGGRYRSRSLPALPPFFRRSATLGARLSAEEITVRSITCQTLNWIGYFSPALLLTPSILETPKVLLGLYGLSHSVRAVSHALNSPVMRCMDFGLRKM